MLSMYVTGAWSCRRVSSNLSNPVSVKFVKSFAYSKAVPLLWLCMLFGLGAESENLNSVASPGKRDSIDIMS